MRWIQYIVSAGVFLMGGSVMAQTCYFSTECDGNQICMDTQCQDSSEPQTVCDDAGDGAECDYDEICDGGVCKPDGVACSSETGTAVISATMESVMCASGSGYGSSSASSSGEVPEVSGDELYVQCVAAVSMECGDEVPVPSEECSAESLVTCTDWVLLLQEIETNCETYFQEHGDDVSVQTGETSTDGVADTDMDAPELNGAPMVGLADEANVWMVVECCRDLDSGDTEYVDELGNLFECLSRIESTDCEGAMECEDTYFGGSDDGTVTLDEENSDSTGQATDTTRADGDSTDSDSCNVVNPGAGDSSLLRLILSF
ncbi:MAG: hypothetical protein JXX29_12065 [Deltaproteobacteria bacterium]|nr:hypothetical protein [Deltaproteobacteria bacterium]MBN2672408.1 hypothetical protein [Deltaproteobacteria bacterium]